MQEKETIVEFCPFLVVEYPRPFYLGKLSLNGRFWGDCAVLPSLAAPKGSSFLCHPLQLEHWPMALGLAFQPLPPEACKCGAKDAKVKRLLGFIKCTCTG